ncbi:hypothetical protein LguiA_026434 [Lonicera macranthoides]
MENWVIAGTAGYISQHWKDRMSGGQRISDSSSASPNSVKSDSSAFTKQLKDKKCPFHGLVQRKNISEDVSKERGPVSHGALTTETASTSQLNCKNPVKSGHYEDSSFISASSLSPGFMSVNKGLQYDQEGDRDSGEISEKFGDLLLKPSCGEMGASYGSARKKSILRSRKINGQCNSLEICLMGQFFKEHTQMEECRPFLVTDGSRIISNESCDSFNLRNRIEENKLEKEMQSEENGVIFGVPPLPNIGSTEILRKTKIKTRKEQGGKLSSSRKMINAKKSNSQGSEASHGALLFSLGISMGMISSFLASKLEVNKLNELLKQTENLVQDLQELKMKDLLNVKELVLEDFESQDTYNNSYISEVLQMYDDKEFDDQKTKEESLLKIEAELEAELERLELNMNSSSLERKLSDLFEFEPDFVPDIVEGELRADVLTRKAGPQPHLDWDGSGNSTTHSANYAVSPTELSLLLHKVLQSRLEERVKELETELQNKQREVHYIESQSIKSCRNFSNSGSGSSSIQEQPRHPVVINEAGDSLDAYGEAYKEFEEDGLHPLDEEFCWNRDVGAHYMPCHLIGNGSASTPSIHHKGEDCNTRMDDICASGDENGSGEMEKLLIKQILEKAKARKDFPAVINAQRALFLTDQNEHRDQ